VAAAAADGAAVPEVVITVDGGYSPSVVQARAGVPLRLVFDRRDDSSCSEEIVMPAFGVRRFLPSGERTIVEFTPPTAGRYPFTCGMGMLRGTVVVDD
jgi:plastocyanin domain-containing protein